MSKLKVSLHTRALVMQANSGISNMYEFHEETPKLMNSVINLPGDQYNNQSDKKRKGVCRKGQPQMETNNKSTVLSAINNMFQQQVP